MPDGAVSKSRAGGPPADRAAIISAVRGFLGETRPTEAQQLEEGTNLFDSGLLDSLGIVSLIVFLEQRFGCSLSYEDLTEEHLRSLSAIADLIAKQRTP